MTGVRLGPLRVRAGGLQLRGWAASLGGEWGRGKGGGEAKARSFLGLEATSTSCEYFTEFYETFTIQRLRIESSAHWRLTTCQVMGSQPPTPSRVTAARGPGPDSKWDESRENAETTQGVRPPAGGLGPSVQGLQVWTREESIPESCPVYGKYRGQRSVALTRSPGSRQLEGPEPEGRHFQGALAPRDEG